MQIAAILHSTKASITLKIHKTQFQKGKSDCGVYAIAYITDLLFGNDPASFKYDQDEMRAHFLECIQNEHLTPFPSSTVMPRKPKEIRVPIYCICRLPDNGEERMIKCNQCGEWYHQTCEKVPISKFVSFKGIWKCSKC